MKHKFINRATGKVVYYGEQGKQTFEKMPQSKDFKYAGAITEEEYEEQQKNKTSKKDLKVEVLNSEKYNEVITSNISDVKELSEEEVEELVSENKISFEEEEELEELEAVEKPKKKTKTKALENEQEEKES